MPKVILFYAQSDPLVTLNDLCPKWLKIYALSDPPAAKSLPGLKFGSAPGVAGRLRRGPAEGHGLFETGGEKRLLVWEHDVGVHRIKKIRKNPRNSAAGCRVLTRI